MHKALIVDDHPFIRATVRMLLAGAKVEVIGEADNGPQAIALARDHLPDLIVLDIAIPRLDGMEVIHRLNTMGLRSRILVLTSQPAEVYAERCRRAGVDGYFSKTGELTDLTKAFRTVLAGKEYYPRLATSSVVGPDVQSADMALIKQLSNKELVILQQLALGKSNKMISQEMLLSSKTISTYKTRLLEKLQLSSVIYLADFAKRNNLI
ncbi:response regulator transcription factor [Pseudomonas sp. dw_358]|uniref:response regulator transcription factor n=1 Tax=Pseudomonas sp. dw_358 TaxID=2720083 RepID=UPI001BD1CD4E|nr:response regulator transcription factor [Pseudomonas sp. dw_358]